MDEMLFYIVELFKITAPAALAAALIIVIGSRLWFKLTERNQERDRETKRLRQQIEAQQALLELVAKGTLQVRWSEPEKEKRKNEELTTMDGKPLQVIDDQDNAETPNFWGDSAAIFPASSTNNQE